MDRRRAQLPQHWLKAQVSAMARYLTGLSLLLGFLTSSPYVGAAESLSASAAAARVNQHGNLIVEANRSIVTLNRSNLRAKLFGHLQQD